MMENGRRMKILCRFFIYTLYYAKKIFIQRIFSIEKMKVL